MKKYAFIIAPILLLSGFYACTHKPQISIPVVIKDTTTNNNNNNNPDTTAGNVDTSVCFQRDVLPVFISSCAKSGCHDAITRAEGYNLTNYSGIVSRGLRPGNSSGSKLYTICVNGEMPTYPTPKLDSTQLSFIRRWIDMGAHNDTNCAVNCDTTKFTYANAIAPILKSYCYACHASAPAPGSGGGIVLDNYNGVLVQVQNGKLMGDLQHLAGHNAMPLGGSKLSDCKIIQFQKWIAAGAQNN